MRIHKPKIRKAANTPPEWLLERQIVLALERRGALVVKIPNDALWRYRVRHTLRGMPDLIVLMPNGRTAFLEVKRPKGRPSPQQLEVHERLRALGHEVYIVHSAEEAITYLGL